MITLNFFLPQHYSIHQSFYIIDNLATDALVSQNPIGTKPTNLAIDGDKSTCSKTKGTDVWFQVDLTEIRIVTELYITGKGTSFDRRLRMFATHFIIKQAFFFKNRGLAGKFSDVYKQIKPGNSKYLANFQKQEEQTFLNITFS